MNASSPSASSLARDLDAAFPALLEAHENAVYSIALRYSGCREDAADITQDTFVRAYRALSEYSPQRIEAIRIRPWLWTIAANCCRNHVRTRSRRPRTTVEHDAVEPPGDLEPADDIVLAAALDALPEHQRLAVVMRHVAGLRVAEISDALDRPPGTIKSDIHRGLGALRAALTDDPEEHST